MLDQIWLRACNRQVGLPLSKGVYMAEEEPMQKIQQLTPQAILRQIPLVQQDFLWHLELAEWETSA